MMDGEDNTNNTSNTVYYNKIHHQEEEDDELDKKVLHLVLVLFLFRLIN